LWGTKKVTPDPSFTYRLSEDIEVLPLANIKTALDQMRWPRLKLPPKDIGRRLLIKRGLQVLQPSLFWCRDPELNWGHADFQSAALPTELSRRFNMAFKEGKSPRLFLKGYYNALHQGVKYFFSFRKWFSSPLDDYSLTTIVPAMKSCQERLLEVKPDQKKPRKNGIAERT
jgi:hypothetical protein